MAAALLAGCTANTASQESDAPAEVSPGGKKVFLSLYNDDNPWSIALANDIIAACAEHGISITVKNANGDKSTQYNDISSLKENEYDMVLLSAVDKKVGGECLTSCKEKNIPAMLVARNADSLLGPDCITLIACDYELVGYSQGLSLLRAFGVERECSIVELAGDPGSSITVSLSRGMNRVTDSYPNLKVVSSKDTSTSTKGALDAIESVIREGVDFQAVFCHSDSDALGAIQALKTAGLTPGCDPDEGEIIISSNCGYDDAIKAVATGELYSTLNLNAHIGSLVVETMEKYWAGKLVAPRIQISYHEITRENVDEWIGSGY